jgi:hypothetical protein
MRSGTARGVGGAAARETKLNTGQPKGQRDSQISRLDSKRTSGGHIPILFEKPERANRQNWHAPEPFSEMCEYRRPKGWPVLVVISPALGALKWHLSLRGSQADHAGADYSPESSLRRRSSSSL